MESSPVQSPGAPAAPQKSYQLFSAHGVMLATLLGSPLAGAVLMSKNNARLGRSSAAVAAFIGGLLADALFFAAVWVLPQGAWLVLWIPAGIFMFYVARILQGQAVEDHQIDSGEMAPASKAFGTGIFVLIFVVAGSLAVAYYTAPTWGTRLPLAKHNLYYSGQATQSQAAALAAALTRDKFFMLAGEDRTVLLSKNGSETVLRFVTNPSVKDDPVIMDRYVSLAKTVAPTVGGLPILVKMVDPDLKVLHTQFAK